MKSQVRNKDDHLEDTTRGKGGKGKGGVSEGKRKTTLRCRQVVMTPDNR